MKRLPRWGNPGEYALSVTCGDTSSQGGGKKLSRYAPDSPLERAGKPEGFDGKGAISLCAAGKTWYTERK